MINLTNVAMLSEARSRRAGTYTLDTGKCSKCGSGYFSFDNDESPNVATCGGCCATYRVEI